VSRIYLGHLNEGKSSTMNLKNAWPRKALIAFGATAAVVAGGLTVGATAANAAGTLTLNPTATSVTTADWGKAFAIVGGGPTYSGVQALNDATYGVAVTTTNSQLVLVLDSAPTVSAQLMYGEITTATNTGPTAAGGEWSALSKATPGTTDYSGGNGTTVLTGASITKSVYFTADYPGTYTAHFVDTAAGDPNTPLATSGTITISVKDVEAATAGTSDDWAPVVSAPASMADKAALPVSASLSPFTLSDVRGSSLLPTSMAALIGLRENGAGGHAEATATAATYDSTNGTVYRTRAAGTLTAETVTSTLYIDVNGDGDFTIAGGDGVAFGTATSTVFAAADGNVTGLAEAATAVSGSVAEPVANAVQVKPGTTTVTYTATTTDSSADKSNKPVYFPLTSGAGSPVLTATGTRLGRVSATVVLYSALTNSSGVASLTVTSSSTIAGVVYRVDARATNNQTGTQHVATYTAPAASTVYLTNTSSSLIVPAGTAVTLTGSLKDQYSVLYQPTADEGTTVDCTMGDAPLDVYGTLSGGLWSTSYTKSVAATAGTTTSISCAFGAATAATGNITWASTAAAASLSFTSGTLSPTVTNAQTDPAAQYTTMTGQVLDSGGSPVLGKAVAITGSAGVYFSDTNPISASNQLATTITVATNGAGVFTVRGFFTKAGSASVTATSGSATATLTGTVPAGAAATVYRVTINGSTGAPGATQNITGQATDGFGNGLAGVVNLSLGTSTLGSLASTQVTANSSGIFSTTFTPASSTATGTATITATLTDAGGPPAVALTTNPLADVNWALDGVTIADGSYQATGAVEIAEPVAETVVLSGPTSRTGAGNITLTGTTTANDVVKVYSKNAGTSDAYGFIGSVTADADGNFSKVVSISTSKTFVASINSDAIYSNEVTVRVVAPPVTVRRSTVSLRATALGSGRVRLAADGGPTGRGTMKFYRWNGHGWAYLIGTRANTRGDATVVGRSPKGYQTFRAVYTAPGRTATGANARIRVR
jgi:hypothetical protein